jgi:hypothetical protein
MARRPVAFAFEGVVLLASAGDGLGRSIDDVSLPGICGEEAISSILPEISSFGELCFPAGPLNALAFSDE